MLQVPSRNELLEVDAVLDRAADVLSSREAAVLRCLAWGLSSKETGDAMGISRRTVECHRASVLRKIQARNGPEAVRIAMEAGFAMSPPDAGMMA